LNDITVKAINATDHSDIDDGVATGVFPPKTGDIAKATFNEPVTGQRVILNGVFSDVSTISDPL